MARNIAIDATKHIIITHTYIFSKLMMNHPVLPPCDALLASFKGKNSSHTCLLAGCCKVGMAIMHHLPPPK